MLYLVAADLAFTGAAVAIVNSPHHQPVAAFPLILFGAGGAALWAIRKDPF